MAELLKIKEEHITMLTPIDEGEGSPSMIFDSEVSFSDLKRFRPSESGEVNAYPCRFLIDLQGYYDIEKYDIRDETGTDTFNFYYISDIANGFKFERFTKDGESFIGTNYDSDLTKFRTKLSLARNARFLIIELINNLGRFPSEIKIYGTKLSDDIEVVNSTGGGSASSSVNVKLADAVGFNLFQWDNTETAYPICRYQRIFFEPKWITVNDGVYGITPGIGGEVNFGVQLKRANDLGVIPIICVQHSQPYLMNASATTHNDGIKPIPFGAKATEVASYDKIAEVYVALANHLKGLGIKFGFEVDNEPNKWWKTTAPSVKDTQQSAWEHAAYCMNVYQKIKAIDSTILIVHGGLAKLDMNYYNAMRLYWKYNMPNGKMATDAWNIHMYCNDAGKQFSGSRGISPEAYNLDGKISKLVNWSKLYTPTLQVWNTEVGYDTNNSIMKASFTSSVGGDDEIQADWLIRCFLLLIAAGVDVTHLYWWADDITSVKTDSKVFLFSGIVGKKVGGIQPPKLAYSYFVKFAQLFRSSNYTKVTNISPSLESKEFIALKFEGQGEDDLIVYWNGTENKWKNSNKFSTKLWLGIELKEVVSSGAFGSTTLPVSIVGEDLVLESTESPRWVKIKKKIVIIEEPEIVVIPEIFDSKVKDGVLTFGVRIKLPPIS